MYPTKPSGDASCEIGAISKNSPAQKSGLRRGDLILSVGPYKVKRWGGLVGALRRYDVGKPFELKVKRSGQEMTLEMSLEPRAQKTPRPEKIDYFTKAAGGVRTRRTNFTKVLEHDVPLRPELCGGPVFNLKGELLGMNLARYDRTSTFFIPISELDEILTTAQRNK